MKTYLHLFACFLFLFNIAFADQGFPRAPLKHLTPGKLCESNSIKRYPEQINYCARDVSFELKAEIIKSYDQEGFSIEFMNRDDFKIDHFIPLCAGGSNDRTNLWPQHKSIYAYTDDLEKLICEKMAEGKLLQKDAIDYITFAKNNLKQANSIYQKVNSL